MQHDSYRWVIVGTVAAILGIALGQIVNGLAVFFTPLEAEFGWARGDIAAINSAGLIGLAAGGLGLGIVADRANDAGHHGAGIQSDAHRQVHARRRLDFFDHLYHFQRHIRGDAFGEA